MNLLLRWRLYSIANQTWRYREDIPQGYRFLRYYQHIQKNVPHDMVVFYPTALQQKYGRIEWGSHYVPDIPSDWPTKTQLAYVDYIVDYVSDHDLFCLFGMNGKKFFIALESKQDAMMMKLSS